MENSEIVEKQERLFYLDFIRTMATFLIVMVHFNCPFETFQITGFNTIFYNHANGDWGSIGVTLFFMISGASLIYNYKDHFHLKEYIKKRWWGIFPMFYLGYLFVFLYTFFINKGMNHTIPKASFLLTLLGMDGYFASMIPNFYLIGEWFLGAIIFIYLLFPLIRYGYVYYKRIFTCIFVILGCCNLYLLQYYNTKTHIIVCLFSFLLGIYVSEYIKKIRWYHAFACFGLFLITIIVKIDLSNQLISNIAGYLFFITLAYLAGLIKSNMIKELCYTISKYSYAIFLVHHVTIIEFEKRFAGIILSKMETLCLLLLIMIVILFFAKKLYDITTRIQKRILFYKK